MPCYAIDSLRDAHAGGVAASAAFGRIPAGMWWLAARVRLGGTGKPGLDIWPALYYGPVLHRPTLDRFVLLATKPGDERGAFRGAERVRTHSPNEATDETDLVAPAGPMDPPGCGRWGFTPSRAAVNAGVVGPISPPAARRAPGIRSLNAGGRFPTRPYHHTGRLPGKQQPQRFECLALALGLSTGPGRRSLHQQFHGRDRQGHIAVGQRRRRGGPGNCDGHRLGRRAWAPPSRRKSPLTVRGNGPGDRLRADVPRDPH